VKLYSYRYRQVLEVCQIFSTRERPGGAGPLNVNLRLPDISETIRARKLNLKIPLDVVKYPLWVQKLVIIRYNTRAAAILTFDKCISEADYGYTTARRLSAYM